MSTHYVVRIKQADGTDKVRLVVAKNQAQARQHVTSDTIAVAQASPSDLLEMGKAGVGVEEASNGAANPSTN